MSIDSELRSLEREAIAGDVDAAERLESALAAVGRLDDAAENFGRRVARLVATVNAGAQAPKAEHGDAARLVLDAAADARAAWERGRDDEPSRAWRHIARGRPRERGILAPYVLAVYGREHAAIGARLALLRERRTAPWGVWPSILPECRRIQAWASERKPDRIRSSAEVVLEWARRASPPREIHIAGEPIEFAETETFSAELAFPQRPTDPGQPRFVQSTLVAIYLRPLPEQCQQG